MFSKSRNVPRDFGHRSEDRERWRSQRPQAAKRRPEMFGSAILDVAIGLIFVFLVMSLIVTAVSELIASKLQLRASNLETGIRNLLHPRSNNDSAKPIEDLTKKIFEHPLVNSLSQPGEKPSYIPSRT